MSTVNTPPSYGVPTGPFSVPVKCDRLPSTDTAVIPLVSTSLLHSANSLRIRVTFIPPAAMMHHYTMRHQHKTPSHQQAQGTATRNDAGIVLGNTPLCVLRL